MICNSAEHRPKTKGRLIQHEPDARKARSHAFSMFTFLFPFRSDWETETGLEDLVQRQKQPPNLAEAILKQSCGTKGPETDEWRLETQFQTENHFFSTRTRVNVPKIQDP